MSVAVLESSSVLLLNKSYMPIEIVSLKRAFCMLCSRIAEVITIEDGNYRNYNIESWSELSQLKVEFNDIEDTDDIVRTPSVSFLVPRILRTIEYNKIPRRTVKLNRKNLFARDKNCCQYCGKRFNTKELNLDHVIPKSRGGRETWENLVCTCVSCNNRKGNRLPEEVGMGLIKVPKKPRFSPLMKIKIRDRKYQSWEAFISDAYWNVELKDD